jgi:hypothetical protein
MSRTLSKARRNLKGYEIHTENPFDNADFG